MANPQPTDPHLRVAHSINEQLMVSMFTEQQRRILDLILRLSWGCGKKEANIPQYCDFELVGVRRVHIKHHLDILVRDKVIERPGDTTYSFNKNFDEWRVSRSLWYTDDRMRDLVRLNLNHTHKPVTENVTPGGESSVPSYPHDYIKRNTPITLNVIPSATDSATLIESIKEKGKEIQIHGGELVSSGEVWSRALSQIRKAMSTSNFSTWFHGTVGLGYLEGVFHLGVRSSIVGAELEMRMRPLIVKSLTFVTNLDGITFQTHSLDTDPIDLYVEQLIEEVCTEMSVDKQMLLSGRRMKGIVAARNRVFVKLTATTELSTCDIGRRLGVKDARVGIGAFAHAD